MIEENTSKCISLIYTDSGELIEVTDKINGYNFFRKENLGLRERTIAIILKNNPHPNIVKIYNINEENLEIEFVNTYENYDKIKLQTDMKKAKEHLQSLGIIYFDWKPDNTGLGEDGNYKLFDFDASGVINLETKEWIIKPVIIYWSYRTAVKAGFTDPLDMDNYAFDIGIINSSNYNL